MLERPGGNRQNDGAGLACLASEFMGGTGPDASTQAGEENDEFCGTQQLTGDGAEPPHALFSQRWESGTTHAVKGVPEPENMHVVAGGETRIVCVDQNEVCTSPTLGVGLSGPRTTDAADSSHENVGGVHASNGALHLNELWCASLVDVAKVPSACIACPSIVRLDAQNAVIVVHCGLEL